MFLLVFISVKDVDRVSVFSCSDFFGCLINLHVTFSSVVWTPPAADIFSERIKYMSLYSRHFWMIAAEFRLFSPRVINLFALRRFVKVSSFFILSLDISFKGLIARIYRFAGFSSVFVSIKMWRYRYKRILATQHKVRYFFFFNTNVLLSNRIEPLIGTPVTLFGGRLVADLSILCSFLSLKGGREKSVTWSWRQVWFFMWA